MKKLLCILLSLVFLSGCTSPTPESESGKTEVRAVWISCYELREMAESGFETAFDNALCNLESIGVNRVYMHVRAFSDSIYPSEYYPLTEGFDGDELGYAVRKCREKGMEIYAWINPYRISRDKDRAGLTNPTALKYEKDVRFTESGAYFDPSSADVRRLIIDGVRELVNNYDIDGIHFDDYFYPSTDEDFDRDAYEKYLENAGNPLALSDFRRQNVTALIVGVSAVVKYAGKRFGVAPAADIAANRERRFADVIGWCEKGLIDEVVPELYFGYCHPNEKFCFENILEEWTSRLTPTNTELIIGLAPYKLGLSEGAEAEEWENGVTVISSEICTLRNVKRADGFALFSYGSVFGDGDKKQTQLQNIREICK